MEDEVGDLRGLARWVTQGEGDEECCERDGGVHGRESQTRINELVLLLRFWSWR